MTAKHKRIAFLMPAGTVTEHDRVSSYHHDNPAKIIDTNLNIGDTFVFEASLRLTDYEQAVFLSPGFKDIGWAVDLLDSCEVAILRGSNYVHGSMEWGNLGEALERCRIPVVAFGIGAQAPRYGAVPVSDQTRRVLQLIADRSTSLGCRGQFTVDTLKAMGIRNAEPIGCPSLFRLNQRGLRIAWREGEPPRRIGFTIARGMAGMYCEDPNRARVSQLALLAHLQAAYDVYVICQNEKAEKIYFYRAYERIEEARALLRGTLWGVEAHPWLEDLYWRRMFFGTSPAAYEAMARFCDMFIGYRLHGNIMALSVGKPAIYQTYDSRTRELVEHFDIPAHDIMTQTPFALEPLLEQPLFDRFNARYPVAYDIVRDFLAANGVAHRMSGAA
jgi:hypothetical protein